MSRLLLCKSCGTLNKLRDYDGPPEYDMELLEIINRHLGKASDPRPESHPSHLMRVDQETYDKLNGETEIQKALMDNEITVRELRDDLKVDALACFNRHGRPSEMCPDYEDDSKVIGRKIGVPKEKRQYLCHYCPCSAYVVHKVRKAKGMYDVDK